MAHGSRDAAGGDAGTGRRMRRNAGAVMTGWHVMNLGDAMVAASDLAELQQRFDRIHRRHGRPSDMALYVQHVSDGRLHCEVLVYFTPAALPVAQELGAEPCAPPTMDNLGLPSGTRS